MVGNLIDINIWLQIAPRIILLAIIEQNAYFLVENGNKELR
jgi:hypothetical protein